MQNLVVSCFSCNRSKAARVVSMYQVSREFLHFKHIGAWLVDDYDAPLWARELRRMIGPDNSGPCIAYKEILADLLEREERFDDTVDLLAYVYAGDDDEQKEAA